MARRAQRPLVSLLLILAVAAWMWWEKRTGTGAGGPTPRESGPEAGRRPPGTQETGRADPNAELLAAWRAGREGAWVTGRARVMKVLDDDLEPPRHQRFLIRVGDGLVVKISHNVDLADRVPLGQGDEFAYRGRYEMGEHGALVHWTHHDPAGGEGGWLQVGGRTYR
jgi:hypothetical protein